jgi:hypothetical protein
MLVLPVVVGAVSAGLVPGHALLLAAWLSGYLAYFAAGLWFRSRRRARYWPPVRAYTLVALVLGLALVATRPTLLSWGLAFGPLLAVSLHASWLRMDRSMLNDTVTVVAACLMPVVAAGVAGAGPHGWPGAADGRAWWLSTVLLAYFYGTVLYVKSMIRDRDDPRRYAQSVAYHVGLAVLGLAFSWAVGTGLTVLLVVLALRAWLVPRRWPRATPRAIGVGEIVACVALAAVLLVPGA